MVTIYCFARWCAHSTTEKKLPNWVYKFHFNVIVVKVLVIIFNKCTFYFQMCLKRNMNMSKIH